MVAQLDGVETSLPVVQGLAQALVLGTDEFFPDHVGDVALAGDEADDGCAAGLGLPFDQLAQFGHLAGQARLVGRDAGQPQDQLVQEQDHGVNLQVVLGVATHGRQSFIEADKAVLALGEGLEIGTRESRHQLRPHLGIGAVASVVEAACIPSLRGLQLAPTTASRCGLAFVQPLKEGVVADALAQGLGITQQIRIREQGRQGRLGMVGLHVTDVATEYVLLDGLGVDHVEVKAQNRPLLQPFVLGPQGVEIGIGPDVRLVAQHQAEHGHEMAFP